MCAITPNIFIPDFYGQAVNETHMTMFSKARLYATLPSNELDETRVILFSKTRLHANFFDEVLNKNHMKMFLVE